MSIEPAGVEPCWYKCWTILDVSASSTEVAGIDSVDSSLVVY